MLKRTFFGIGLAAIVAIASAAQADSMSFSTDFAGTTLPTGIAADTGGTGTITVDDGLTIAVPALANIWADSIGGPTVRYSLDPNDTRDFTVESVMSSRSGDVYATHSGLIMVFGSGSSIRTGMFGPYVDGGLNDFLRYEDNVNQPGHLDVGYACDYDEVYGSDLSFHLRIVRHGSDYTFSYKGTDSSDWIDVGTLGEAYGFDTTGPSWVGLYSSSFSCTTGNETCTYSSFSYTVVPEPSVAMMMLATGVFGLLAYAWRKRR